jgi:hypothetical protein
MNRSRHRWFYRLAILLAVGLAGLLWLTWQQALNRLTVENRSGQPITLLQVTIGGETCTFRNVAAEAEVTAPFRIKSDDHFAVAGQLADGTILRGRVGYVTNGMARERARLIVLPGGQLLLRQGGKR